MRNPHVTTDPLSSVKICEPGCLCLPPSSAAPKHIPSSVSFHGGAIRAKPNDHRKGVVQSCGKGAFGVEGREKGSVNTLPGV